MSRCFVGRGRNKGASYERELCKMLSLWWTGGVRDDVFWRTAGSGGRATNRQRIGKKTYGQQGDIQATDPIGAPLTRLVTIEAKRGHPDAHIGDVMDRTNDHNLRWWEQFVKQSIREARDSGTPYWLLIMRRDKRTALVYMPWELYMKLELQNVVPWLKFRPPLREGSVPIPTIFGTTLEKFLKVVKPKHIIQLECKVNA